jgi:hypothetical protein
MEFPTRLMWEAGQSAEYMQRLDDGVRDVTIRPLNPVRLVVVLVEAHVLGVRRLPAPPGSPRGSPSAGAQAAWRPGARSGGCAAGELWGWFFVRCLYSADVKNLRRELI